MMRRRTMTMILRRSRKRPIWVGLGGKLY
jgi:hypothetical protein